MVTEFGIHAGRATLRISGFSVAFLVSASPRTFSTPKESPERRSKNSLPTMLPEKISTFKWRVTVDKCSDWRTMSRDLWRMLFISVWDIESPWKQLGRSFNRLQNIAFVNPFDRPIYWAEKWWRNSADQEPKRSSLFCKWNKSSLKNHSAFFGIRDDTGWSHVHEHCDCKSCQSLLVHWHSFSECSEEISWSSHDRPLLLTIARWWLSSSERSNSLVWSSCINVIWRNWSMLEIPFISITLTISVVILH